MGAAKARRDKETKGKIESPLPLGIGKKILWETGAAASESRLRIIGEIQAGSFALHEGKK